MQKQYGLIQERIINSEEEDTGEINLEEKLKKEFHSEIAPNFGIAIVDMNDSLLAKLHPEEREEILREQRKVIQLAKAYDLPVQVFEYSQEGVTTSLLKEDITIVPRYNFSQKKEEWQDLKEYISVPNELWPTNWLENQGADAIYFMGIEEGDCLLALSRIAMRQGFTIATSNEVLAVANDEERGDCAQESCAEAKSKLLFLVDTGMFDIQNKPFLEYFAETRKNG